MYPELIHQAHYFLGGFCGYECIFLQGGACVGESSIFSALRRPYNGLTWNYNTDL